MRGFKIPFYIDNKIIKAIPIAVFFAGGVAITFVLLPPHVAVGIATTGVVMSGLEAFGYIDNFETVCQNAIEVRLKHLSKTKIKKITQWKICQSNQKQHTKCLERNENWNEWTQERSFKW